MSYRLDGPEGNESAKVHDRIAMFVSGHGLDIGCGCWKLKVHKTRENSCLGVDGGYSELACKEADIIADVTNLSMFRDESFDYVYSSHTLEDMHYTDAVLSEWWRLIKPGGNLLLYLPLTRSVAKEIGISNWQDFYPNIGEPGVNVHHVRDFHPQEIRDIVSRIGDAEILVDEVRGEKDEYSFLLVFRKLSGLSVGSNSAIQCLCEYHRRHFNEKGMEFWAEGLENERTYTETKESNSSTESSAPIIWREKSLVQDRSALVQEQGIDAS